MVALRLPEHPRELEEKLLAAEIEGRIVVGEFLVDQSLDDTIDLRLLVVLVGADGELQGQPDQPAVILAVEGELRPQPLEHLDPAVKHGAGGVALAGGEVLLCLQPVPELVAGGLTEAQ